MRLSDYYALLRENQFQIHPARYPMSVLVGGCTLMNSVLAGFQNLTYGRRIDETELVAPPVFVVGHWRSGTTLLHELLALDDQLAFPSNFDAFIPHHFLISRFFFYPLVSLLMPPRRPMDEMSMSVASPQEDDFALCASGAPTPYRRIAFPNRAHDDHQLLNLHNANDEQLLLLHNSLRRFFQQLTIQYGKRLVLKSPPHTGRIEKLSQWFPEARFIHISRHPYKLIPSTMRLWQLLDQLQGFQLPKYATTELQDYIFQCKDLMYAGYFSQRGLLPANRLVEMRFEDLIAEPVVQLQSAYERLELPHFEALKPKIEAYFSQKQNHKTNPLSIDKALQDRIDLHWQDYKNAFGY